jgi:hypothetical protein
VTALSTVSTVGLSAGPRGHERAHHATRGTKVTTAILRALAPPLRTRAKTALTALSTASTARLLVGLLDHAHAHAKQDTKVRAVRLRAFAPPLQTRLIMALAGAFTASTAALLAALRDCNCTSCDVGYEGSSCHTVIPSPPPPLVARPPPPSSVEGMIANAKAKTEQAEVSRDALLADIGDENTKAKAKLLVS